MPTNQKLRMKIQQKEQNKQNSIKPCFQIKQQSQVLINPKQSRKKTHQKTNQPYRESQFSQQVFDQPQISNQISQKIQQLHTKMKSFFNIQKRNHQQLITPNINQLRNDILKLRQDLLKPKSHEQVEKEKLSLMKRKALLLDQMQLISKNIKTNKKLSTNAKFQYQQIQRQLMTAQATLEKYKKKAKTQAQQSILQNNTLPDQTINNDKQTHNNNYKKLNSFEQQAYHIHITQITNNAKSSPLTSKASATLPVIEQRYKQKNFTNTSSIKKLPFRVLYSLQNTSAINEQGKDVGSKVNIKKNNNMKHQQNKFLKKKVPYSMLSEQSVIQNSEIKFLQQQKRVLRHQIYSKLSRSPNIFDKKKQTCSFAQKYQSISNLFSSLHHIQSPSIPLSPFTSYQQFSSLNPIECIQEVLMEELRKMQYSKFQQKGYHQGLKSKTHQIRIDLGKVFTNQEKEGFFARFMQKRQVQKLLDFTLRNALL